jgi:hypothetical protein
MREPKSSRPQIPDYGIPTTEEGMLPWSYMQDRMREAINYWVSTASLNGQPHATPVWGIWLEDILYFDGSPRTRRGRDLAANPRVSIHLEDGTRAVMLEGNAVELTRPALSLRQTLSAAYTQKYAERGYSPGPETWESGGLYRFEPRVAFAWTQFPADTTRWHFEE